MKNIFSLFVITLSLSFSQDTQAQYILRKADAEYKLFNYIKAIDLYEKAYRKKQSLRAAERLAICNEKIRNFRETESWAAIAATTPGSASENRLRYAVALQQNGKYGEARLQYEQYAKLNKNVSESQLKTWLLACDSAVYWLKNPRKDIRIEKPENVNSAQSDWGAVKAGDTLYFVSDRRVSSEHEDMRAFFKFDGAQQPDKFVCGWTGNGYLRLYGYDLTTTSIFKLLLDAETDYHLGPASFTADGKEVFFALTRIPQKKGVLKGKLATVNVEIYSSKKDENGHWSAPVAFPYNNVSKYSLGDPFITADGKRLYFVSNSSSGKGGTDIYYSLRNDQSGWGEPVNVEEINTEGNERYPCMIKNDVFYFSSDGWIGMGGLDIFQTVYVAGRLQKPVNMGYPLNSPQDDFAFTAADSSGLGYLSSNRTGGMGADDIYSFTKEQFVLRLEGVAYHKETGEALAHAMVSLSGRDGTILQRETTSDGKFSFDMSKNSNYRLKGEKTGFLSDRADINTRDLSGPKIIKQDLYLDMIQIDKPIKLDNIYYDFGKSDIRADAAVELDKLVKIMEDNPTIWVELGSHTDSRGRDKYNLLLSQQRADSAVQYIINKGISRNRIFAKGYGEMQLINKCSNNVPCPEWMHQENRRTEFRILKF